ncbi:G2/M phase-specific E3 ubiquitin-protein ligase-like [Thunnus maccoyii]|uniref:G2/M phase-specific E3 ubiquitin-protein ligase-like n=1 Tax=Thunnus maccoyii TaxID=8240 RepID=UPI001C4BEF38|nr:G2/M phase-specific E3 ubiquitin-protein ligase-like [Thunnus maccoyii]
MEDVNDLELRENIQRIADADSVEDIQTLTSAIQDYLANAGCLRHIRKVEDKTVLVKDILTFQVINRIHLPLQRFTVGLKCLFVLQKSGSTPKHSGPGSMDHLFNIRFSMSGSSQQPAENQAVLFWRDYLQDTEEGETDTTLSIILIFATGSSGVPPIGFSPEPPVEFIHDRQKKFPTANTCELYTSTHYASDIH